MDERKKRAAHFEVRGAHVDGTSEGTLTIEPPGMRGHLVSYRPKGSRKEYILPIDVVAEMVAWRAAKREAGRLAAKGLDAKRRRA